MPSFELFRKQKNQDESSSSVGQAVEDVKVIESEHVKEVVVGNSVVVEEGRVSEGDVAVEGVVGEGLSVDDAVVDVKDLDQNVNKLYLKAMPLRDTLDLEGIKAEVEDGNILILRITPLASKSVEAVKSAVNELYVFTESIGGDIARLGEERVVICPKNVRIWREKALK
jgi:SepF-like predicted cell division protein (DUF552 family)